MKLDKAVDKLVLLRNKIFVLQQQAAVLRGDIIMAGGGESEKYKAVVVSIRPHVRKYQRFSQLRIFKKAEK